MSTLTHEDEEGFLPDPGTIDPFGAPQSPEYYRDYVAGKMSHLERGDAIGPPPERGFDPMDDVIQGVIGAMRAENRLYPDLYAWMVVEAVREHLAAAEARQAAYAAGTADDGREETQ